MVRQHSAKDLVSVGLVAVLGFGLTACQSPTEETTPPVTSESVQQSDCIENFDPDQDYFPDKTQFDQATGITVDYHNYYKVVTVKQPYPDAPPEQYVLVQCGAPEPELSGDLASAVQVEIPVKAAVASSTTQIPAFEMLDEVDALAGVTSVEMIHEGPVLDAVEDGSVKAISSDGMEVNLEDVVSVEPDVFISSGYADPVIEKLQEIGIPVLSDAEWLETSALGRAEWIKFIAILLNAEADANEIYDGIYDNYQSITEKTADVETRPTVILGVIYDGQWSASGADSYVADMIRDAGGEYVLSDLAPGTGSTPVALEEVIAEGSEAQYWLNAGGRYTDMNEVLALDPRLENLAAVQDGQVWTTTRRLNENGGNDYWQSGVVQPDLVLADITAILHPELMPDHELVYYEQVPQA